jgi:hypothetical protein
MMRLRILGLALVAVFAVTAVAASSASAAKNGPHWWGCEEVASGKFLDSECSMAGAGKWEKKELLAGEKRAITFTSGETKLVTKAATILCKKDKGTGEIIGGWPGIDKAAIEFEECEVEGLKCEAKTKGGTKKGVISVNVNTELVYVGTKVQAEEEKPPLGILFKTVAAKNKIFVELEFGGICALDNGPVTATGEEHGPGIPGVAGVVCKAVEPIETYKFTHEINCVKGEQTKFFYWEGGVLKEGKAGLEFHGEVAEQVGKAVIKAGVAFDARGT